VANTNSNISVHHILCPTDFSVAASGAFAESIRVARWFGAKVTVLHVMAQAIPAGAEMVFAPPPPEVFDAVRKARLAELDRFVAATEHAGVPVDTRCREGVATSEIRDAAEELDADLVVMGTHGRSGFGKLVLGSVTESLLRHAPVPILTVNSASQPHEGLYRCVLCAVDASEWSAETIGFAAAVAEEGAERLTVLHVIDDLPETRAWAQGVFALGEVEQFRDDLEQNALADLRKLIPENVKSSCGCIARAAFGRAPQEILRLAAGEHADLIVLGTHGRGALNRILFGSTARRVVREATCPVLVVPSGHTWPSTALARHDVSEGMGAFAPMEGGTV